MTSRGLEIRVGAIVIVLQSSLSLRAWEFGPYFRHSAAGMADTILCLSDHPELAVPVCEPNHVVCGWPPDVRNRLVGLLREHRLNVFSPDVGKRHGLSERSMQPRGCVPSP